MSWGNEGGYGGGWGAGAPSWTPRAQQRAAMERVQRGGPLFQVSGQAPAGMPAGGQSGSPGVDVSGQSDPYASGEGDYQEGYLDLSDEQIEQLVASGQMSPQEAAMYVPVRPMWHYLLGAALIVGVGYGIYSFGRSRR